MKNILKYGITLSALAAATSVFAADIPRRASPPAKAPAYVAPYHNWSGFYAGINGGYGWGSSTFTGAFPSDFDVSGGLIGGTLGYNWQVGQAVFGLETDLDWTNINGSAACAGTTCETRNRWLGTLRGRLGYGMDRFMPYVTGGLAYGDVETTITGVGNAGSTKTGWTVGGGLEAALAGPWTAKIEYLYVDLGTADTVVAGTEADYRASIVRAGVNFRF